MTFGLNLLPRTTKRLVELEATYDRWRGGLIVLIVVLTLFSGSLFGLQWMLEQRDHDLQAELRQEQALMNRKGALDISQATIRVNEKITLLSATLPTGRNWAAVIRPILGEIPSGIEITGLEITATGQVSIKGTAKTRAAFLSLQQAMSTSKALVNPVTSDTASKREDLPFTYSASLPAAS